MARSHAGVTTLLALAVPAAIGAVVVLVLSRRGFYVSPDSVSYAGTARNLLDGHGFTAPPGSAELGHFPPLFTLVLAGLGRVTSADPLTVARWLNGMLFGATILATGFLVRRASASVGAGMVAALLVLAGFDFLSYYGAALSEPLFMVACLGAIAALARYIDSRRPPWLVASAVLAAMAMLTRYAGVALVIAGVAALLWWGRGRRRHGALEALVFACVAGTPAVLWLAWVRQAAGAATEREVVFHGFGTDFVSTGVRSASEWFFPRWIDSGFRIGLATAASAAVIAGVVATRRQTRGTAGSGFARAFCTIVVAFAGAYVAVMVFDRLFLDITAKLDRRLLLPLHVAVILIAVPGVHDVIRRLSRRSLRTTMVAVSAVVVGLQLAHAGSYVVGSYTKPGGGRGGFTAPAWRNSAVIAHVKALDPGTPVFSNAADAIFLLSGRRTEPVPAAESYLSGRPNPGYASALREMRMAVERDGAVVVWFHAFTARQGFLPSETEIAEALAVGPAMADSVGTLYRRL